MPRFVSIQIETADGCEGYVTINTDHIVSILVQKEYAEIVTTLTVRDGSAYATTDPDEIRELDDLACDLLDGDTK